jgi:hypothetical protein
MVSFGKSPNQGESAAERSLALLVFMLHVNDEYNPVPAEKD